MDEELREAIEKTQARLRLYLEYVPRDLMVDGHSWQLDLKTITDAAERSRAVDDLTSEVGELRERVAHLQREADDAVRNQDTLAKALGVDDAKVREKDDVWEAVELLNGLLGEFAGKDADGEFSGHTIQRDWNAFHVLKAAALTPRTRWYTPEVDGPPTDTSKWLIGEWRHGSCTAYKPGWYNVGWGSLVRYTYLDPPPAEEPLPKCWCGGEMKPDLVTIEDEDRWAMVCQECSIVGPSSSTDSEADARENWRKLRGHS